MVDLIGSVFVISGEAAEFFFTIIKFVCISQNPLKIGYCTGDSMQLMLSEFATDCKFIITNK